MNHPLSDLAFAGAMSAVCAMSSAFAQAPSWNAPDGRNSSLPKPPPSGVVNKATGSAVAVTLKPPRDIDCTATIKAPGDRNESKPTHWYTDGTEDHGQILNGISSIASGMAGAMSAINDMQARIEQLRCEEQNTKAKLDFLIHTLVHE